MTREQLDSLEALLAKATTDAPEMLEAIKNATAQAREALELREALEKAHAILFAYGNENDGTQHPWWAVVKRSGFGERAILAGPFFSRERAQQHYEARRYEYGKAIVYCFSGHYSQHYRDLRETLEAINKARRGM